MTFHLQFEVGDICGDPTGLRVRVEDVDMYDYVHFCVIDDRGDEGHSGEMSSVAFGHRFTRLANRNSSNAA
jgi:hypothetical protein